MGTLIRWAMVSRIGILLLVGLVFGSCGREPSPQDTEAYGRWLADPENGFVVTKESPYLELEMQHLPSEYLGWREIGRAGVPLGGEQRDSVLASYAGSLHFTLTVRPREGRALGDVAMSGVASEAGFQERVRTLNFEIGEYFELKVGEEVLEPVLTNFENTYGLTEFRRVQLVFPRPVAGVGEAWDLRFVDEVFGSGGWHFGFVAI